MAHINLLPWRELKRKEQQQQFIRTMGLAALGGLLFVVVAHVVISRMTDNQRNRNQILKNEISVINKRIRDIKELEETRQALLDRMDIIQQLQRSRPVAVHLFDELVTTLPGGLFLTQIRQNGNTLEIKGKAESDARVSTYMSNLENSPWLQDPRLEVIETVRKKNDSSNIALRSFILKVDKEMPQTATDTNGDKHGS
jgi:type IV pilus assembly protein PilN